MLRTYQNKKQILEQAEKILQKSLREVISSEEIVMVEKQIGMYRLKRKGFFGDLIEQYFFRIHPGNISEPDFIEAKVELKTTPLKSLVNGDLISKERLVFSMIPYDSVVKETWESSSFLKKNKTLLLMFYLWINNQSILDYKFKFLYMLNLLESISQEDIYQIRKDWEYIVEKIKRGEAHLLSEGDTYYLGACTKAKNSSVVRDQPMSSTAAKPRAFSFKQQYINYLIQTQLLKKKINSDSIFRKQRRIETIDTIIKEKFYPFIGQTDQYILKRLHLNLTSDSKSYKRLLVNRILEVDTFNIAELDKANITLRVMTLESTGNLRESISFPAFDYKNLVTQTWFDSENETMADFHSDLETKKFLFVVFQKQKGTNDIILRKILFWNFPMKDIGEAERVWQSTIDCINDGRYDELPKMRDSRVAHVRPHGKNSKDTIETPQRTQEMKRCFWLNAKYIQSVIESDIAQG